MKRKLISVLLAGAMVFSLAACGNSGSSDSASDDSQTGTSSDENTLTVWTWDPAFNIKSMEIAAEQYAADHEGFKVEIIETSSDDCQTKLTTAANAGDYSTMPDIVLMQDNSYQKYLTSYPDAFTDLSDIGINWDDFAEGKQSYSMLDGVHYGVPFDNGVCAGLYRTDVLAEAGYTIDDLTDITWTRFMEIGKDVHEKTGKYLLTSESTGGDVLMLMIQSCGANFVDEDGNAFIEGNDIAKTCVEIYTEMIKNDVVLLVNNWDDYVKTITTGQAAGIVNGNWITGTIMSTEDQKGLWEITNIPSVDGVDTATNYANNGGSSWYITANCQKQELAMDFLASTFGSSTDFYDAILPESGAIATYLPAAATETYTAPNAFFNDQPIFSTLLEYSSHVPEFTKTPYHYESREIINTAVQNIVDGADVDSALAEAQETLEFRMSE